MGPYLPAAIAAGVPYLDLCDDSEYAKKAKKLHAKVGRCRLNR